MPARQRAPRRNPLIPVAEPTVPSASKAPICGTCFPAGWPKGGDYASCPHGDWSTTEGLTKRAAIELAQLADDGTGPYVIDGVTTDGVPVTITVRPGEPALVSLAGIAAAAVDLAEIKAAMTSAPPFAPAPIEVDPAELDAGEDIMFMPSGG
jgi:hypothetical protein